MTITMDLSQAAGLKNLSDKTLPQLKEMLERQEQLASNRKLLSKLPDKGTKVLNFLENLRSAVNECQRLETNKEKSRLTEKLNSTQNSSNEKLVCDVSGTETLASSSSLGSPDIEHSEIVGAREDEADLSSRLDNLTVSELAAPRMSHGDQVRVAPGDNESEESSFFNNYGVVMKRSAEIKHKRAPFKPNSSINVSKVEDLPESLKLKSRGLTRTPESRNAGTQEGKALKPHAESAAQPPAYSFDHTREISIVESISLQKQQKEQLEQIKSVHAAEKLAERLNINTDVLGQDFVDMAYRTPHKADDDSCDSDDEPDEDDHDVFPDSIPS